MVYWFIIEGPDNIGKTHLVEYLKSKLPGTFVQHFVAPKGKTIADKIAYSAKEADDYVRNLRELAKSSERSGMDIVLINDRSIFGELVYSKYRNYEPKHLQGIVRKLQRIKGLQTTFLLMYGEHDIAKVLGIKFKDDCKEAYAHHDKMAEISVDFIRKVHHLHYPEARKLVFNLANYSSLDERNSYVYAHVRAIINDVPYKFKKTDSHCDTPFNVNNKILTDGGFTQNPTFVCKRYSTCPLGKEHKSNCKENGGHNSPIYGYGGMNPYVVLVGEVSHHNEKFAGHLPFYNSVSGCVVQQALYDLRVSPFDVYITNVIKCTPLNNDLGKYKDAVSARDLMCANNILNEIEAMQPRTKTIICLGATAFKIMSMVVKPKTGWVLEQINHPSYYARMGTADKFTTDLSKLISGGI